MKAAGGTHTMSDVCIDCAGKPRDYRSERTHLALDPETGATIAVPHTRPTWAETQSDRDLAVLYRRAANVGRRHAFLVMMTEWVINPAGALTNRHRLGTRIAAFLPVRPFTATWTPEARRAFHGIR